MYACVELFCDNAPLWKCEAGLKLGSRSPGVGRSLEFSPPRICKVMNLRYQWEFLRTVAFNTAILVWPTCSENFWEQLYNYSVWHCNSLWPIRRISENNYILYIAFDAAIFCDQLRISENSYIYYYSIWHCHFSLIKSRLWDLACLSYTAMRSSEPYQRELRDWWSASLLECAETMQIPTASMLNWLSFEELFHTFSASFVFSSGGSGYFTNTILTLKSQVC